MAHLLLIKIIIRVIKRLVVNKDIPDRFDNIKDLPDVFINRDIKIIDKEINLILNFRCISMTPNSVQRD